MFWHPQLEEIEKLKERIRGVVLMYYVLITDNDGNENRLKARTWDEVLLFVRMHRGKIKEFKFKRK